MKYSESLAVFNVLKASKAVGIPRMLVSEVAECLGKPVAEVRLTLLECAEHYEDVQVYFTSSCISCGGCAKGVVWDPGPKDFRCCTCNSVIQADGIIIEYGLQ